MTLIEVPDELAGPIKAIVQQYIYVDAKHGPYASAHEGWAVLHEELQELFAEVRKKDADRSRFNMVMESFDIAVAAIRFAVGAQAWGVK